ncbi:class II aldolase/adducin family protein [Thioalkalivibrio sp. XN8]|uniref:class II aldolase/adducin family protein n=1 Tax=Thioalkalivibrio sp. XN8 TaxID=2712863 RepID=UPI0013E9DC9F|nr:class II aldolase/adducin family protein [Thioalkalivibrio sp. XN8]NGP52219.1 class II aldolase/adducin family protein [Thioalkalivibrio sp. XN8]
MSDAGGAPDPRADLVRYYRWLRQHGLNDSHSGNASVRDGDAVWVTPTGCCGDTLTPEALLRCSPGGPPPAGASLDAPLHLAVYAASPGARAVLHSHGPHSIAMTLAGGDFLPRDFEGRYYFPRVPVLDIPPEDYVARSPAAVAAALAGHRACIVRGHGVYAAAETLDLAYKWTCSLESSARLAWLARVAGTAGD